MSSNKGLGDLLGSIYSQTAISVFLVALTIYLWFRADNKINNPKEKQDREAPSSQNEDQNAAQANAVFPVMLIRAQDFITLDHMRALHRKFPGLALMYPANIDDAIHQGGGGDNVYKTIPRSQSQWGG